MTTRQYVLRGDGVAGVTSTAVHSSTSTVPHQWARAALHRTRRTPPKLSTSARRHHAARSAPLPQSCASLQRSRVILRRGTGHGHLPRALHAGRAAPVEARRADALGGRVDAERELTAPTMLGEGGSYRPCYQVNASKQRPHQSPPTTSARGRRASGASRGRELRENIWIRDEKQLLRRH